MYLKSLLVAAALCSVTPFAARAADPCKSTSLPYGYVAVCQHTHPKWQHRVVKEVPKKQALTSLFTRVTDQTVMSASGNQTNIENNGGTVNVYDGAGVAPAPATPLYIYDNRSWLERFFGFDETYYLPPFTAQELVDHCRGLYASVTDRLLVPEVYRSRYDLDHLVVIKEAWPTARATGDYGPACSAVANQQFPAQP